MLKLNKINIDNNGSVITYDYTYDRNLKKYFTNNALFAEYKGVDVSCVPIHIKVIPFLANFLPISWFVGFDVYVEEIDEVFYESMIAIRKEFTKYYPRLLEVEADLKFDKLVKTSIVSSKSAVLFSGGVDAFTTFFRHYEEIPDLVTIHGADIKLGDMKNWENVVYFNENERIISQNNKYYIKSNLRDFYTFEVDKLLTNLGWWGFIQHGVTLTSIVAPLSYLYGYSIIYIASSYTRRPNYDFIPWGSMPEIDNKIKWADTIVIHDGYELTRQDKIDTIVSSLKNIGVKTNLRVCYSDAKDTLNCSVCEKCLRTIWALMINGVNPNDYGFSIDTSIYQLLKKNIRKGFKTEGTRLFWKEILDKANQTKDYYYINNHEDEQREYESIKKLLKVQLAQPIKYTSKYQKLKLSIINRCPKLFTNYLIIRRRLQR